MPDLPHLAFPFAQNTDGTLAVVEQDTIDDVRQCVHVLLRTPIGIRPLAPAIGVEDPTFNAGIDAHQLEATLEEQEDRALVTVTAAPVTETGEQEIEVHVALASEAVDEEPTA